MVADFLVDQVTMLATEEIPPESNFVSERYGAKALNIKEKWRAGEGGIWNLQIGRRRDEGKLRNLAWR